MFSTHRKRHGSYLHGKGQDGICGKMLSDNKAADFNVQCKHDVCTSSIIWATLPVLYGHFWWDLNTAGVMMAC